MPKTNGFGFPKPST